MTKARHKHLLDDPQIKRWYDNLARGSPITADERLRRLGRMCVVLEKRPFDFVQEKRKTPEEFDNFVLDFVSDSLKIVVRMIRHAALRVFRTATSTFVRFWEGLTQMRSEAFNIYLEFEENYCNDVFLSPIK
jgi:hypothetical protein